MMLIVAIIGFTSTTSITTIINIINITIIDTITREDGQAEAEPGRARSQTTVHQS